MGQSSSGVCCAQVEGGEPVVAVEEPEEVPSSPPASAFPPPGKLVRVVVVGARGVRSSDWFPGAGRNAVKSDPYCIVEVPGKPKARFKTAVNETSLDPVWNHEHTVEEFAPGDRLVFTVLDTDMRKPDDHLGRAQLTSARLKDLIFFDGELPLAGERAQEGSSIVIKVTLVDQQVALVNGKAGEKDQKAVFDPGEDSEYKAAPDPMTVGPVTLTKDQNSFGANLRRPTQKNILVVNSINEGSAWHTWNKTQSDDAQIKAGDRVLTVNNEAGDAKMLFEAINVAKNKDVKKVGLEIQRPAENRITVSKDDRNSLGLMLGSAGDDGFFVNEVQESGIIETQWNVHIDQPQKRVTEGDLLIAVNGVRGAKGLQDEMNKSGKLVITFLTHYDPAYLGLRSSRRS